MCGIALVVGEAPDETTFRRMLTALEPRGEVEETCASARVLAGTQRLPIVDRDRAGQPWRDGDWLLCFNGEVFNHEELRAELTADWRSDSDTEVVLAAFRAWGEDAVARM